jgi:lipopolysaccharide transport system ATP-binding protein
VNPIAISARQLGKRYRLRETGGVTGFADLVSRKLRRLMGTPVAEPPANEFWALKDVSFDIRKGEVVGLIGHNGAGKSTLLKILTRITNPTEGMARVNGRVGMLLEVGTGFHPDLTGRENVFVGGAILGMTRHEIRRKYDDIVAFAEMESFMDTPVRHYSSGMSLRLALSVAIHLDADVVFLDEIWAVGDHAFQFKTWRRIEELIASGRTFVIVVHNLDTIERLCERCLLLDHGRLTMDGAPADVIARYRQELRQRTHGGPAVVPISGDLEIVEAKLISDEVHMGDALDLRLTLDAQRAERVSLGLSIRDSYGKTIAIGTQRQDRQRWASLPATNGRNHYRCTIPAVFAPANTYTLWLELRSEDGLADCVEVPFAVAERALVVVDEAGRDLPVPTLSVDWKAEFEGITGERRMVKIR